MAVGYRLTYVYPEKNNSRIIGVDYSDIPYQLLKVQQAIDTKKRVIDGPIPLLQGVMALSIASYIYR